MDVLLLSLLTLIFMYVTMRSALVGVGGAVTVAVLAGLTGTSPIYWLSPVIGGLLMGLLAGAHWPPSRIVVGVGLPVGLLLAWLYLREERAAIEEALLETLAGAAPARVATSGARAGLDSQRFVEVLLDLVVPALMILLVMAVMGLTYAIACRLFPRLGVTLRRPAPLATWRPPFTVIWTLAAALGLMALGWSAHSGAVRILGSNLCLLHGALFFVLGLAVIRFGLVARGVPGRVQAVLAALLVPLSLVLPLHVAVAGIGLLDMWYDFRKLDTLDDGPLGLAGGSHRTK